MSAILPGCRLKSRIGGLTLPQSRRYVETLRVPSPSLCKAAAGDPHSILGVPPDADSQRVENAYRKKKMLAEKNGDTEAVKEIEAAHNSIFMASLNSRLSGKGPVEKQIKNADKIDMLPWRPKIHKASDITLKWSAGVYGAILLYNFLLKASPQGVEAAMIAGVVLNCWKQYQLFPTDQFADLQKRLEGGWRNLFRVERTQANRICKYVHAIDMKQFHGIRDPGTCELRKKGALLTVLASITGIVVCWSGPDLLAEVLGQKLPFAFYESQGALLTLGSLVSNFLFTAFIR